MEDQIEETEEVEEIEGTKEEEVLKEREDGKNILFLRTARAVFFYCILSFMGGFIKNGCKKLNLSIHFVVIIDA